jgi:integrase
MNKQELSNLIDYYKQELEFDEFAPRTIKKYIVDAKRFIDFLDHNHDIDKNDAIEYKSMLMDKYKAKSVNSYLISLNKFLKYAKVDELVLKMLKIQEEYSFGDIINDQEYRRLMKYAESSGDIQLLMIMKVIKSSGCRISEIRFVTAEAIYETRYKDTFIPIRSKGKNRMIIITNKTRNELLHYCKSKRLESGPIFTYSYSTIWRHMKKVAGLAKINKDKVYPHIFRHYFAKLYLQNYSNSISELADILGHSSIETTRIYTRTTNEEKRRKMEQL